MALATSMEGVATITETIFENRFQHVAELVRMGARIRLEGRWAVVEGPSRLTGATVMASDLRASAALAIAASDRRGRDDDRSRVSPRPGLREDGREAGGPRGEGAEGQMTDCLFCRIAAGEIPSKTVFSDDRVYAFHDISPKAPTHVLVIPRRHIGRLAEAGPGDERARRRGRRARRRDRAGPEARPLPPRRQQRRGRRPDGLPPPLPPARRPTAVLAAGINVASVRRGTCA